VAFIVLCGCGKQLNKRITLWRNDKIPYGTYYAFHNLEYLFNNADIETSDQSPVSFYANNETSSAYIIVGNSVMPNEKELKAILNHAIAGNNVFISALHIGDNILDTFKLSVSHASNYYFEPDSLSLSIVNPANNDSLSFSYPGFSLESHFTEMDSSVTNILGKDEDGRANFVKFTYQGGGAVFLHLAPAAFTNFFLLHGKNKTYYDMAMSAIPDTVTKVRWDDYFRHHINGNNDGEKSAFSILGTFLRNEVLRWAFWLTILLFGIVYLFESKRKQRPVPEIKKLNNTSLDFVKTIGQLYYQRKDNKNLAQKMAANFLGHVRNRYNLQTSTLDKELEEKLAYKSGCPVSLVREIIEEIRMLDDQYEISDDELMAFNDKINTFINKP
jgi:hypothetical protein